MRKPSLGRLLAAGAFMAFAALWPLKGADAAQRVIGTNGASTAYAGQRNVIYKPGIGYWAFFKATNADRVVWRFSVDGQVWSAKDEAGNTVAQADVFPFLSLAPDAAWGNPSVWYAANKNRVYVVANDAANDAVGGGSTVDGAMGDATGNKLFVRYGSLNDDGSITWSNIVRQRMTERIRTGGGSGAVECQIPTNNTNVTYDVRAQRAATVVYSSSTLDEYVMLAADTAGSGGFGMGTIVLTNLSADVSSYIDVNANPHVYTYCQSASANTALDNTLEPLAQATLVPVRETVSRGRVLMTNRADNIDPTPVSENNGAYVRLSSATIQTTAEGTEVALGQQFYSLDTINEEDGFGVGSINEVGSPVAHFAYIDTAGDVSYRRRNNSGSWTGPFTLDATGTSGTLAAPLHDPAISVVQKAGTIPDTYIVYSSSDRSQLNYVACRNNAASTAGCDAIKTFRQGADFANPKLGLWGAANEPLPIMWSDLTNVYFDKIITSTFTIPVVTNVSTAVFMNAHLTRPNFDVLVTGINLQYITGVSSPTPSFRILASSEAQTDIAVTSVTYVSSSSFRASIVLSTHVLAGFDFDMRVGLGDGQEYPTRYDRNGGIGSNKALSFRLNPPTITDVSDEDMGPNPFVSGGTSIEIAGPHANRAVRIGGTGFMNWTGQGAASVLPSTNTVSIQFQNASGAIEPNIAVDSLTYTGSTYLTAYLDISTATPGGQYTLILTNPSSGTALSAASTFYVTVPTASITAPLTVSGNSLGFTAVAGKVGFSAGGFELGQTFVSSASVRITHVSTGKVWNGSVMTTSGFADEEAKWRLAVLSPGSTAYSFPFDTSLFANVPDDGPYEIAVRAQTNDGGIGDPYYPAQISTKSVNLDRFPPAAAIQLPVAGATNTVTAISYQFSDMGTGVLISSIMVQDIGIPT
ncbi:MAG: hypothetical protein PHS14_11090, partial [Elusimicrobia bacterium]|nr:hypothetical protein [Elusimicrobiota bacterium]